MAGSCVAGSRAAAAAATGRPRGRCCCSGFEIAREIAREIDWARLTRTHGWTAALAASGYHRSPGGLGGWPHAHSRRWRAPALAPLGWRWRRARPSARRHGPHCRRRHCAWVGRRRRSRATMEAATPSTRGSGWAPRGPALSPWEWRAAQSRQARAGEAQEPSSGAAKGSVRPCCRAGCAGRGCRGPAVRRGGGKCSGTLGHLNGRTQRSRRC